MSLVRGVFAVAAGLSALSLLYYTVDGVIQERNDAKTLGLNVSEYRALKFEDDHKVSLMRQTKSNDVTYIIDFAQEYVAIEGKIPIASNLDLTHAGTKSAMKKLCQIYRVAQQTDHISDSWRFLEIRNQAIVFGRARCDI